MQFLISALRSYIRNIDIVGLFGVLLVLAVFFAMLPGSFLDSGGAFLRFEELGVVVDFGSALLLLLLSVVVLLAISLLTALLLFSVRQEKSTSVFETSEVSTRVLQYTGNLFLLFMLFALLLVLIKGLFFVLQLPMAIASLIAGTLLALLAFAPAAVVVDDTDAFRAILRSVDYALSNMLACTTLFLFGFISVAILALLSLILDPFFFMGKYISLLLNTFVVLPLYLIASVELYMRKYSLVRVID